jgi:hypothetical protein
MSPLLIKISKDLKLVRCPCSLAPTPRRFYVAHSHGTVLAPATLAALPSTRAIETRSVPTSLAATHRGFAFYVAFPKSSIPLFATCSMSLNPSAPFSTRSAFTCTRSKWPAGGADLGMSTPQKKAGTRAATIEGCARLNSRKLRCPTGSEIFRVNYHPQLYQRRPTTRYSL